MVFPAFSRSVNFSISVLWESRFYTLSGGTKFLFDRYFIRCGKFPYIFFWESGFRAFSNSTNFVFDFLDKSPGKTKNFPGKFLFKRGDRVYF